MSRAADSHSRRASIAYWKTKERAWEPRDEHDMSQAHADVRQPASGWRSPGGGSHSASSFPVCVSSQPLEEK